VTEQCWPAPAKLNLFLHITGRRADGYHELQTVFQFLDFCDSLQVEVTRDSRLRRVTAVAGLDEESDICLRAARLLQTTAGVARGADIHLHKKIPMGGGLGGGSSDAATTLLALNRVWGIDFDIERLAKLGLQLGADVPVFIHGRAAWAEGVGERLQPVELPEPWYLIIAPAVQVSTAEIFQAPDLTRDCPPITIRHFLAGTGLNVCEPVVRSRYPQVATALDWLAAHTEARMTGTGACVFGRFQTQPEAQNVLEFFRVDRPLQAGSAFIAQGLNRSPLLNVYQDPASG
jgi:4-diphosphocytidyl-2-C-methyl-D-erythritol kinase